MLNVLSRDPNKAFTTLDLTTGKTKFELLNNFSSVPDPF